MECNKDEASRAKEIAEKKFIAKDIAGAKKFALKAQKLYPALEGVSQMLATLDVHLAAVNKVNGESDYYEILGANPRDDDDTMKKKYRKLALTLHPDKNKSIGAEGAFKYISEAFSLLSNKEKKADYDRKRSLWSVYQKVSASSANNGFPNFAKSSFATNSMPPKPNYTQKHGPTTANGPSPSSFSEKKGACNESFGSKSATFWTICLRCMLQYEYRRIYVNCSLLCPNCRQSYLAVERPSPRTSPQWSFIKQKENRRCDEKDHTWTFSRTGRAAHAAAMVQKAYAKVKKEREEAQAAARKEEYLRKKRTNESSSSSGNARKIRRASKTSGSKVTYQMGDESGMLIVSKRGKMKESRSSSNVSASKIQNPLIEKSKNGICKNVSPEIKSH